MAQKARTVYSSFLHISSILVQISKSNLQAMEEERKKKAKGVLFATNSDPSIQPTKEKQLIASKFTVGNMFLMIVPTCKCKQFCITR